MNAAGIEVTNRPFSGSRIEWRLNQPFALSLQRLRSLLKTPSPVKLLLYSRFGRGARLENYLRNVAGELGLMILGTIRHGLLMSTMHGPRHAQMFLIGNPLTALSLMKVFKQAGVYAPLRIMFCDDGDDTTIVTYDAPSKVLAQFDSPVFTQTGERLEKQMETVIRQIAVRQS